MKKLLFLPLICLVMAAQAQYSETFSIPNKGYLINFENDFTQVNWTLSTWDLQPPAEFGRDEADYFRTNAAGVLEAIDLDQEVCWLSPDLLVISSGGIDFSADLTWMGFDAGQTNPLEYINVEVQINSGIWERHPNVLGPDGDPNYTVSYTNGMGNNNGSVTTGFSGITLPIGDTIRARICVSTNANAEVVTIDNVNMSGVTKVYSPDDPNLRFNVLLNPFWESTTIAWNIPSSEEVQLEVVDLQGKLIYSGQKNAMAGAQEWVWHGGNVPAGVYVLTLRGEGWQVSRQLVKK